MFKAMNYTILSSLGLFVLIGASNPSKTIDVPNDSSKHDTLYWENHAALSRSDFLGSEPYMSQFAAYTYTIILMEYDVTSNGNREIQPNFSISAAFNKKKSWISKASATSPDRVLKHEQVHFDIAELTARKLRKALHRATYTRNFRKEINSIYKQQIDLGEAMQEVYDEETRHGLDGRRQREWEMKVEALLLKEPQPE
jgi:hypothetical protein